MKDKDMEEVKNAAQAVDEITNETTGGAENDVVNEATNDAANDAANDAEDETVNEASDDAENSNGEEVKKDKKDLKIEELNDKYMRTFAEFDNFRKRSEKEKAAMFEVGAKNIIEKILPVVDNFERGLATVPEDQKNDPFVEGMDKIYKQFITALEDAGVKTIEAVGTEFNPDLHNAVMHIEDDSVEENIVVEEFQKGYMYRDSVVRHSMVKVAN